MMTTRSSRVGIDSLGVSTVYNCKKRIKTKEKKTAPNCSLQIVGVVIVSKI